MLLLPHTDSKGGKGSQVVWFSAKVDLRDQLHANNNQFHFRLAKPNSMHCKLCRRKVWLSANSARGPMLDLQPKSVPKILLESDSSSALQLLVGQDIPKRSRHVEIRLAWMNSKMASGELEIEHRAGTDNVADLFTKCLSTKDFLRHRASLGFEVVEMPARGSQVCERPSAHQ